MVRQAQSKNVVRNNRTTPAASQHLSQATRLQVYIE